MQNIIGQWLVSLRQYVSLSLFLSSPERLPYNPLCTALTIFTYYMLCLGLVDEERSFGELSAHLTLELSLLALFVYGGLRWKNSIARFQQTFSALVGINMVITLASILVYRIDTGQDNLFENPLFYLLLIWNLAAMSLIFKRSLEIPVHLSAMIAFNYYVFYQFILVWFYW
ncbi:MAG: hypothetical protein ACO3DT_00655 [Gammaproteobacteria bacterium]